MIASNADDVRNNSKKEVHLFIQLTSKGG